jgi:hypothetical protein
MPLDIAMQNAQLKKPTNVDNTNYLLRARAYYSYCIFYIVETQSRCLYLVICFSQ